MKKRNAFFSGPALLVFSAAFLLYAHTVSFEYALDDKLYITHNQFTKEGVAGIGDLVTHDLLVGFFGKDKKLLAGGRYRPLPLVTFAVEYEIFGEKPYISHFLNVVLYGATCMLLYAVLGLLFPAGPKNDRPWYLSVPFVASMLFALHPLHTEVAANIKSRDEMMSLLGALGALFYTLRYLGDKQSKNLAYASLCFLGGLLSKESTVTFLAAIPLTVYFFRPASLKNIALSCAPLFGVFAAYMLLRAALLDDHTGEVTELMNNPFVHATNSEKYATIFYTMGLYIKLLFFPHPLTNDYFPKHIPIIGWSDPTAVMSLLLHLALVGYALAGLKKKTVTAWAIWFYLVSFSLFSNLVFPIGSFMNERFMYVPSIGYCVAIAWFLAEVLPGLMRKRTSYLLAVKTVLLVAGLGYGVKTVARSFAWENDFTLALTDVHLSPNSAKANMSAGASLIDKANNITDAAEKKRLATEAVPYLAKALQIYPSYKQPMLLLGNAFYLLDDFERSFVYYENALKLDPVFRDAKNNMEFLGDKAAEGRQFGTAKKCFTTLLAYDPGNVQVYGKLGQLYGRDLGDLQTALTYLAKANELAPNDTDILQKLGIVYSLLGQNEKALDTFMKAYRISPDNAHILLNIGITYNKTGDTQRGQEFLEKAFVLDPSLRR